MTKYSFEFKLRDVLHILEFGRVLFRSHIKQMQKEDPDKEWKEKIYEISHKNKGRYGYRRIMGEIDLKCGKFQRKSRYKSYKGTVGKVAKNRLNRRFDTNIPLQKLVTDVTEFKCRDDRELYLSPIMGLYNSEVISYGISNRPTLDFVKAPLNQAIEIIKNEAEYRTTIHSDQGWHYQHNT